MVGRLLNFAILALLLNFSSSFLHAAQVLDDVVRPVHGDNEDPISGIGGIDFYQTIRDKRQDNQPVRKTGDGVSHKDRKTFLPPIVSDSLSHDNQRKKRDVIEEEKYYGSKVDNENHSDSMSTATQWLPESVLPEETQQTTNKVETKPEQALPLRATTEALLERQNGRGARGTDDGHWVKLQSYPREDEEKDALTVVSPPPDDLSARMPRVNFITQNKRLDTSESRSERDSLPRAAVSRGTNELRTDFMHPVDNRARSLNLSPPPPVSSDPYYYPEESRRRYDERYPDDDMYVARNPYYDMTYARRTGFNEIPYRPRLDRYGNDMPYYDPIFPVTPVERSSITKPKRIIYYANLPEVVRTPPNVDLRYRYTAAEPHRQYDDQYTNRDGRVDYRFRNRYDRYPHGPYKKDVTRARDLISSGTDPKDKRIESERQTTSKPEEKRSREPQRNLNSHQYPMNPANNGLNKPFPDVARVDYMYRRYDQPSFQAAIDDPYIDRHD